MRRLLISLTINALLPLAACASPQLQIARAPGSPLIINGQPVKYPPNATPRQMLAIDRAAVGLTPDILKMIAKKGTKLDCVKTNPTTFTCQKD